MPRQQMLGAFDIAGAERIKNAFLECGIVVIAGITTAWLCCFMCLNSRHRYRLDMSAFIVQDKFT